MDKEESYGRPNLFVYCKDTCDPRGLYYAKNEVDKVIDDMMAEARTDNSAGGIRMHVRDLPAS